MVKAPSPTRRWLFGALAILFILPCSAIALLGIDEDPPDDADLHAAFRPISEADNAYAEIDEFLTNSWVPVDAATQEAEDEWYGERPFPKEIFAAYIAKNDAVLDRVASLARSKKIQLPIEGPANNDFLSRLNNLATWVGYRARVRALNGELSAALEDSLIPIIIGKRLEDDGHSIFHWLIATIIRSYGYQGIQEVLAVSDLDEGKLLALDKQLQEHSDFGQGLPRAHRGEYLNTISRLGGDLSWKHVRPLAARSQSKRMISIADGIGRPWVYKPNITQRIFAEVTRAEAFYLGDPSKNLYQSVDDPQEFDELISGNILGYQFLKMQLSDQETLDNTFAKGQKDRISIAGLRTLIAIRRYQLAEDRAPKTLRELQPKYLKDLPLDFDGEPLRYAPDKKLIYSIGRDSDDKARALKDPQSSWFPHFSFARKKAP